MSNREFVELRVETPFGELTAKDWGCLSGIPSRQILALHGWQDNAGTFDSLLPWLNSSFRVVCIDLAGHGFSSHRPLGSCYHMMEYVMDVKRIVEHLRWKRFTLLGHSMGGGIAIAYACVFSQEVEALITIDIFKPLSTRADLLPGRTRKAINQYSDLEKKTPSERLYSWDEALERLHAAQRGSVSRESTGILLKRGLRASPEQPEKFTFTRDPRVQIGSLQLMDDRVVLDYIQNLTCDFLVLKAKQGMTLETEQTLAQYREIYEKRCGRFLYVEIDGTHHVQLNDPQVVAPYINSFLEP